jgi:hypothetical protein
MKLRSLLAAAFLALSLAPAAFATQTQEWLGPVDPNFITPATTLQTTDPGVTNDQTQGYFIGAHWMNTTNGRVWVNVSAATGAAYWAYLGVVPALGSEPPQVFTNFGGGTGSFGGSGNLSKQVVAATNAGTTANVVLATYTIPAGSFDAAGRCVLIEAAGGYGATNNSKTVYVVFNPTTYTVGSSVVGGTTIATTGALTTTSNGGGWTIGVDVCKYGAAASNTQTAVISNLSAGSTFVAQTAPVALTATEASAIPIALVANATSAASDVTWSTFFVAGSN